MLCAFPFVRVLCSLLCYLFRCILHRSLQFPTLFFVVSTTVLRRLMSLGYCSMASPPPFSVMIYILFFFFKFSRDDRYVLSCKIHIAPKRLRKSLKSRNTLRMILTYMWILVFRCTCGHRFLVYM